MTPFDMMEPRAAAEEQRKRRFRPVPLRMLAPNLITLIALCSGITAIRMAIEGRFELSIAAIIFAIVLDALDGRIARLLKGTSRFGAELDSLADFVNFGVAPAVVIYLWSLQSLRSLGWIVALWLAICTALRLARFNVALDDPDKPAWKANYFTGVPAPAGAGLALLPMYLGYLGVIGRGDYALLVLAYVAFVGFLMVSQIPTFSGKQFGQEVRRDMVLPVLLVIVFFAALLVSFSWLMLTLIALVYLAFIPVSIVRYREQESEYERARETADQEAAREAAAQARARDRR